VPGELKPGASQTDTPNETLRDPSPRADARPPPLAPSPRRRLADHLGSPSWALLTGLLLALSFPPFPFYGLAWVALVPMLARWWSQPKAAELFREAYAAFLIATTLGGYWVLFHADPLKALLGGAGLLFLPLPFAMAVVGSGLLARKLGRAAGAAALVTGWLVVELCVLRGMLGAPWLLLGHTQAQALLFNQFADLGGVGALSLWVWALNGGVFVLLLARTLTLRFALVLGVAVLVLAPVGYRGWNLSQQVPERLTLSVAVAQPAYRAAHWAEITSVERVQRLADLSDEAMEDPLQTASSWGVALGGPARPDLVIWPEGALPVFPDARLQHTLYARLAEWTERRDIPLLTGAVTRYDTAPALTVEPVVARQLAGRYPYYNSALLFDGRRPTQQYDKVVRVPGIDRVPSVGIEIGEVIGASRSFGPGGKRTVFESRGTSIAALIGYEVWFGDHTRRMVADGAESIVLLSNSSWWGASPVSTQQEAAARLRAIETRRAVITASVAGGSGVVYPDGRAGEGAGWMEPRVLTLEAPIRQEITPYVRYGDVVYHVASGIGLGLLLCWGLAVGFLSKGEGKSPRRPKARPRAR